MDTAEFKAFAALDTSTDRLFEFADIIDRGREDGPQLFQGILTDLAGSEGSAGLGTIATAMLKTTIRSPSAMCHALRLLAALTRDCVGEMRG